MSRLGVTLNIGAGMRRALLVILALIIFTVFLLPRQTQSLLERFAGPLTQLIAVPLRVLASTDRGIREMWNRYIALQGVYDQNVVLQERIEQLEGQITQLREQTLVSEQLTELLAFQNTTPVQTVAARVIGRNATNWYRALIVDKGEHHGIRPNMGVISHAGVVGRVVKTHPSTAIVLLLTDPNVAVTGMIQRGRDEGIVQGTAQGYIRMKYLPPLSPVQVGDHVVTSGLTGDFPRGLQIGNIHRLEQDDAELFQSVEIQPVVDFSKLEGVLIITSPGQLSDTELPQPVSPPEPDSNP